MFWFGLFFSVLLAGRGKNVKFLHCKYFWKKTGFMSSAQLKANLNSGMCVLEWNSAIKKCFLIQVSQYTFAMCSYREKKSEPQELMQLEGYTVDYTAPHTGIFHDFEVYLCKTANSICSFLI